MRQMISKINDNSIKANLFHCVNNLNNIMEVSPSIITKDEILSSKSCFSLRDPIKNQYKPVSFGNNHSSVGNTIADLRNEKLRNAHKTNEGKDSNFNLSTNAFKEIALNSAYNHTDFITHLNQMSNPTSIVTPNTINLIQTPFNKSDEGNKIGLLETALFNSADILENPFLSENPKSNNLHFSKLNTPFNDNSMFASHKSQGFANESLKNGRLISYLSCFENNKNDSVSPWANMSLNNSNILSGKVLTSSQTPTVTIKNSSSIISSIPNKNDDPSSQNQSKQSQRKRSVDNFNDNIKKLMGEVKVLSNLQYNYSLKDFLSDDIYNMK